MQLRATRLTAIASAVKRAFNIRSLFAGAVPGVWYDPSDYTTLFQDSAGTTPVTAVEQPVGLMLDKSQGLVLGSELVTNGDFSNGSTGWTLGATTTVSGGSANFLASTGFVLYRASVAGVAVGGFYEVTFTVTNYVAGSVRVYLGATPTYGATVSANGTYTARFGPAAGAEVGFNSASAFTGSIDNVSVKAVAGNHAFQATSASRPVLSARYNLLTKTEDFSAAAWVKTTGVTGYSTGRITYDGTGVSGWRAYQSYAAITSGLISVVVSGTGTFLLYTNNGDSVSITATSTPTRHTLPVVLGAAGGNLGIFQSGNTAIDVVINFDLRVSNNGITQPTYQRVNTATDYATTGFLPYLKFDGVDDSLSTNSISFTGTDKMSVFAGVRKLSDALAIIAESSANFDINNGTFALYPFTDFRFASRGTVTSTALAGSTAPITNVLTGLGDISGDRATLRINGAQVAQSTTDQGTGNFGNYPLYIGRRGGTTLPFNGQLYSMIIVGKAVTAGELSSTETYVNSKTGAY